MTNTDITASIANKTHHVTNYVASKMSEKLVGKTKLAYIIMVSSLLHTKGNHNEQ